MSIDCLHPIAANAFPHLDPFAVEVCLNSKSGGLCCMPATLCLLRCGGGHVCPFSLCGCYCELAARVAGRLSKLIRRVLSSLPSSLPLCAPGLPPGRLFQQSLVFLQSRSRRATGPFLRELFPIFTFWHFIGPLLASQGDCLMSKRSRSTSSQSCTPSKTMPAGFADELSFHSCLYLANPQLLVSFIRSFFECFYQCRG